MASRLAQMKIRRMELSLTYLVITCLLISLPFTRCSKLSLESEFGDHSYVKPQCLLERRDITKFYLFKANAAPIVVKGRANFSNPENTNEFVIYDHEFYKGHQQFHPKISSDVELKVDLLHSPCIELQRFKRFRPSSKFIFYLDVSAQSEEDDSLFFFYAEPDVYKKKIEKTMKEEVFCRDCYGEK